MTLYEMRKKIRYQLRFSVAQFLITFTGNLDNSDF